MSNIIHLNSNPGQAKIDAELARIDAARPVSKKNALVFFGNIIHFFNEENHEWDLSDLFYAGCIFLAILFVKSPKHPLHPKSKEQVMLPMQDVANEVVLFENVLWEQALGLQPRQRSAGCNEAHIVGLRRRFLETVDILHQVGVTEMIFNRRPNDASVQSVFFQNIEFRLRQVLTQFLANEYASLRIVLERDPEIFVLVDYISRIGMLAGIGARLAQLAPAVYIAAGKAKYYQVAAEVLSK